MSIASNGQTLTQMPHPMQSSSEIREIASLPRTMHSSPLMFTGHSLMHSRPHFFDWHSSRSTTATLWVKGTTAQSFERRRQRVDGARVTTPPPRPWNLTDTSEKSLMFQLRG